MSGGERRTGGDGGRKGGGRQTEEGEKANKVLKK